MNRLLQTSDLSPLRHNAFYSRSSPLKKPARPHPGAHVLSHWVPFDIWPRIAVHLTSVADQAAFQSVCLAAYNAIHLLHAARRYSVCSTFNPAAFPLPPELVQNVLMVHVVPPHADSLILFLDDSASGNGVDLAWLKAGRLRRLPLGLHNVPATTVSNIRFSPDASRIAFLVTLAHGNVAPDTPDPLHRLRGWDRVRRTRGNVYDIEYDPCDDCTVQIVHLCPDSKGRPQTLKLHTFSHVFVPEYGFDMVWRHDTDGLLELAFAAMLHSSAGAATYLVRWRNFISSRVARDNFVFMACIDGASSELLRDKRKAMLTYDATKCTSRIEIANDARSIFFDTVSKFGILRFDQVVDPSSARVTRADLPNNPRASSNARWMCPIHPSCSPTSSKRTSEQVLSRLRRPSNHGHSSHSRPALRSLNVGNPVETRPRSPLRYAEETTRISRMSPNGSMLCSIVCTGSINLPLTSWDHSRLIEMRSSKTGRLLYRRHVLWAWQSLEQGRYTSMPYEKSAEVAMQTMTFSANSQLIILWDTHLSHTQVVYSRQLPLVMEARTGRLIQDFGQLGSKVVYEFTQAAPDGLTLYGARMHKGKIVMDAIDVMCGNVLKTSVVTGSVLPPQQFSVHASYLLRQNVLHTVSRGWVDVLWQTTQGSLGCGWSGRRRLDEHEVYGDELDESEGRAGGT